MRRARTASAPLLYSSRLLYSLQRGELHRGHVRMGRRRGLARRGERGELVPGVPQTGEGLGRCKWLHDVVVVVVVAIIRGRRGRRGRRLNYGGCHRLLLQLVHRGAHH